MSRSVQRSFDDCIVPIYVNGSLVLKYLLTYLTYSSGRFRGGGKNGGLKSPGGAPNGGAAPTSPTGTSHSGGSSGSLAPRMPPISNSPSLSQTLSMSDSNSSISSRDDPLAVYNLPRPKPAWLHEAYAKHIVKGNFMTLSARPKTVEQGEWIAHQGKLL